MSSIRDAIEAIVPKFDFEYDSQDDVWRDESVRTYRQRMIDALCEGAAQVYDLGGDKMWRTFPSVACNNNGMQTKDSVYLAIMLKPQLINQAVTKAEIMELLRDHVDAGDYQFDNMAARIEKYGVRE